MGELKLWSDISTFLWAPSHTLYLTMKWSVTHKKILCMLALAHMGTLYFCSAAEVVELLSVLQLAGVHVAPSPP